MSTKLAIRDGGKTSEEGIARLISKGFITEEGVIGVNDLLVAQAGTPDNTVRIPVGDILIGKTSPYAGGQDYYYHAWVTAEEAVTIAANSSGNARVDSIVAYIDLSVVSSAENDNPGALKFYDVQGTPAGTPVAPTDAEIQAAIGAGNPWVLLANVAVSSGFTQIITANITDKRPKASTLPRAIADHMTDFIASGFIVSQTSGLAGQITAGQAYISGERVTKPLITKTFTASKDTYIDLPKTAKPTSADDYTYTEVSNGADAPALADGSIRIAVVVTNGSAINDIKQVGKDNNGVRIYNTNPVIDQVPDYGNLDNLLRNSNFINNSTNGYGNTPDDWTANNAYVTQGGCPELTKQQLIDMLGVTDGQIEALWNLNGNFTDLSSNGYNLTAAAGGAAPTDNTVNALMEKAKSFASASSQYATGAATNAKITGQQTWILFFRPATIAAQNLCGFRDSDDSEPIGFVLNSSGTVSAVFTGLTTATITSDVILTAGKFYMIVARYSGTTLDLFINGVKKSVNTSGSVTTPTSNNFSVGRLGDSVGQYVNGIMQNVAVLSTSLSDSQIKSLYANTLYKGVKINRNTVNGHISQSLRDNDLMRLRGKTVTLRAKAYQKVANTATIVTYVGTEARSRYFTEIDQWVDVEVSVTIPDNCTSFITRLYAVATADAVWYKDVRLYVGNAELEWKPAPDDWARFPRLLNMDFAKVLSAYQFEEKRTYTYTPVVGQDGTMVISGFTPTGFWGYNGNSCLCTVESGNGTTSGTAAKNLTASLPMIAAKYFTATLRTNSGGYKGGIFEVSANSTSGGCNPDMAFSSWAIGFPISFGGSFEFIVD